MPRRIAISTKLAAALAVPICALLLVSVLEVRQSSQEQDETRSQTELATAAVGPGGVITSLQNERNVGSVWLLGFEDTLKLPVASFEEAAAATDRAIASFRDDLAGKGPDVRKTFEPGLDEVQGRLGQLRQVVTTYDGPRSLDSAPVSNPFFSDYTELIDRLFVATSQSALAIDDATLRRGVELANLGTHQIENLARTTRILLLAGVSPGGKLDTPEEIAGAAGLLSELDRAAEQVRELGTGPYRPAAEKADRDFTASGFVDLAREAVEKGTVRVPETMASLSREEDEGYNGFRKSVYDIVESRAGQLNDEATAKRQRYLVLAALALVSAGAVTWLVSRSITRPLRALTRQAKDMADRRLPDAVTDILETPLGEDVTVPSVEPVVVHTRDEVADVADALNTVQDSALDLAVEQAVLRRNIADSFVNLGRRNQNLLGRQLDFITELESNETDPDTLANLFRLDHLATRMRRNAESLLVLAGIDPPRKWAAPVRLTDVIRAALSEVEDYQRVIVRGVEPATIMGSAAADLAHLLAELIENALVFSPPDQPVDIRGRANPDGYTLAIIDSGLGMPPPDIAAANRRLAGAESFTIAPSKYLGHYVAGNLAARHGIRVTLDNSPGNGVTATVDLPASLLTDDPVRAAAPEPPPDDRGLVDTGTYGPMPALSTGPAVPTGPSAAGRPAARPGVGRTVPGPPSPGTGPAPEAPAVTRSGLPSRQGRGAPAAPAAMDPALLESLAAATPQGTERPWSGDTVGPRSTGEPLPTRTASGLVKRSPRNGDAQPAAVPDGELLASLSNITGNLGRGAAAGPGTGGGAPTGSWPPAAEGGRSWPVPPGLGHEDPVAPDRPVPGGPPGAGERPPLAHRRGGPPEADRPLPPPSAREPAAHVPPADLAAGQATSGGLARRVRGAQLPSNQPLNLRRRRGDHPPTPPEGYGRGERDELYGQGPGDEQADGYANGLSSRRRTAPETGAGGHHNSTAHSVYGFLTSFTQGVQRGLEEARRDPNGPKENP